MKTVTLAASILALAALLWAVVMVVHFCTLAKGMPVSAAFLDMHDVPKFLTGLACLLGLAGCVAGAIGLSRRGGGLFVPTALIVLTLAALLLTGMGYAYSDLATRMAMAELGVSDPTVIAPSRAEAWAILCVGFAVASVLMILNSLLARKPLRPAPPSRRAPGKPPAPP